MFSSMEITQHKAEMAPCPTIPLISHLFTYFKNEIIWLKKYFDEEYGTVALNGHLCVESVCPHHKTAEKGKPGHSSRPCAKWVTENGNDRAVELFGGEGRKQWSILKSRLARTAFLSMLVYMVSHKGIYLSGRSRRPVLSRRVEMWLLSQMGKEPKQTGHGQGRREHRHPVPTTKKKEE